MMTQEQIIAFFQARNKTTNPSDPHRLAMIDAAETVAGRPFASAYRALIQAAGGIDLGSLEFADPDPNITVGYYPKLVKMGQAMGLGADAMPVALNNGVLIVAFPDNHLTVHSPNGPTGETWPDLASFLSDYLETE